MASMPEAIVLASASTARAALLRAAGVDFTVVPAAIDEDDTKRQAKHKGWSAASCARALAIQKAMAVSSLFPDRLVIGADQLLAADDKWFDKPHDLAEAREQLLRLRGRSHVLASAVCVAKEGDPLWQLIIIPELRMRRFSDRFIDAYIAFEGEALLGSVGAYRLEGRGVQLFERIVGDHFAVLGLPLIELLDFLRQRGTLLV
jgi:septum formation protein